MLNQAKRHRETNKIAWQSLPLGDVFLRLNSKRDGLTAAEAERRLKHFGSNNPKTEGRINIAKRLRWSFFRPGPSLFILAGGVAFYLGFYRDSIFILAAAGFIGLTDFLCERRRAKVWSGFREKETSKIWVRRDGIGQAVEVSRIVPGDIIFFRSGDIIPADGRLISSLDLRVDEQVLTGSEQAILKDSTSAANKSGMVFGGTAVLTGNGEAIVFGTGQFRKSSPLFRPFQQKIFRINRFIIFAVSAAALMLVALGFILGRSVAAAVFGWIVLAAAAWPSALDLAAAVIFENGARRILKENILLRNPAAAENLGRVDTILAAKTGVLTVGEMKLVKILTPERRSGVLELSSSSEYAGNHVLVLSYGLMCADAPGPDLINKAVVEAAYAAGLDSGKLNQNFKKLGRLDFSGERFSVSFRENRLGEVWLIVMGDPDVLLECIRKIQVLDRYENAAPFELNMIKDYINARAKAGFINIAIGSKKIDKSQIKKHFDSNDIRVLVSVLNLTGLLEFKDPPSHYLKEYLALARRAGIHTAVLTGGNSVAARFAAREAGLWPGNKNAPEIMEGRDILPLSLEELGRRARNIDIFSRTGTELKLRIAKALKQSGQITAAVGRETLFLKEAEIGLALNDASASAKAEADAVFLKNNFSALIRSIRAGRAILENFKKASVFLLSLNLAESGLILSSYIFGPTLPLSLIQILLVNLIISGFLAASLAGEPAEKEIMELPPPGGRQPILSGASAWLTGAMGLIGSVSLFLILIFFRASFENTNYTSSAVWAALGLDAIFMSGAARSLRRPVWAGYFSANKYFLAAAGLALLFLILAIYLPQLQTIFGTEALGGWEWAVILGVGIISFGLIEGLKWIIWRKNARIV